MKKDYKELHLQSMIVLFVVAFLLSCLSDLIYGTIENASIYMIGQFLYTISSIFTSFGIILSVIFLVIYAVIPFVINSGLFNNLECRDWNNDNKTKSEGTEKCQAKK